MSKQTLAIVVLAALVPVTAMVAYNTGSEPAADSDAAAVPPDIAPAVESEPVQSTTLPPEPMARALAAEPEVPEVDEQALALAAVSEQLAFALELLDSQSEMLAMQSTKLNEQAASLQSYSERVDRMETSLDQLQASATLIATGIDVTDPSAQSDATLESVNITTADDPASAKPEDPAGNDNAVTATALASSELDAVEKEQQDDPTRVLLNSLPGAMRLPGTNTVMKWGGYVKNTVIRSFDPLATDDRFITGAIPVTATEGIEEQTAINVSQSRLNLDMREPTRVGLLRAFVEGDFNGEGDTFRLRHAFGQRGNVLAGKTWSGFVDRSASPEEVDFEGLNGRINVRQAQFRFQPGFGKKYEMAVSLEDPSPEVTNGSGVSQVPDLVVSGRVNINEGFHTRLAVLLRQVRAQPDSNPDDVAKEIGFAAQISGSVDVPLFNQRDKVMFQLNVGRGYGRYVNDLNSVGEFDGVFDDDGDLELIDVLSGYVSLQHWWRSNLRSNFTLGFVALDNPSFVDDSFYKSTTRLSGNLFWTPTPRFDLGAELLWGEKETEGNGSGTASQFQFAARYLF